jgi:hypothetical protein
LTLLRIRHFCCVIPVVAACGTLAAAPETFRNMAPAVAYVGSNACAGCHPALFRSFRKTAMGRSMAPAQGSPPLDTLKSAVAVHSKSLNRSFSVFRDGPFAYQSEYESAADGTDVFRNTQKLEYVMGSGVNGFTYLIRRDGFLLEAPLSYYSRAGKWDLSPGYEAEDIGFSRPVPAGCVVCHSGRPQALSARSAAYRDPPFQELAIGCENCHGPGALHVAERTAGRKSPGGLDPSIVNPARLSPWLADNICMYCHQGSTTRVLQPGRNYDDFRPGKPLDETMAILAPVRNDAQKVSPLLEHFTLMTLSECYRSSAGRMGCATCHDPHSEPDREAAPAWFREKCLTCHTDKSCRQPLALRGANDCAGCHMPKTNVEKIAHSVLTDHRIVKRPGQAVPSALVLRGTPELPDLVHVNKAPGQSKELPALTLSQAYRELAPSNPAYQSRYEEMLDRVAKSNPDDPFVLSGLAYRKLSAANPEKAEAEQLLSRAIRAGSTSPQDFESLAGILAESGRPAEATAMLERGIGIDPYYKRSYKALVLIYISQRRYNEALSTMRRYLTLFPEDSFMRTLLDKVAAVPGR